MTVGVATRREEHRSPRSGPAVQHRVDFKAVTMEVSNVLPHPTASQRDFAAQKSFEAVHQYGRLRGNKNILSRCTEGLRALPDDASSALRGRSGDRRTLPTFCFP